MLNQVALQPTWHIHQGEVGYIRGVHRELDWLRSHSAALPLEISICLVLNLVPDCLCRTIAMRSDSLSEMAAELVPYKYSVSKTKA